MFNAQRSTSHQPTHGRRAFIVSGNADTATDGACGTPTRLAIAAAGRGDCAGRGAEAPGPSAASDVPPGKLTAFRLLGLTRGRPEFLNSELHLRLSLDGVGGY